MKLRTDASTILLGGAIAGALDLLFATTFAGFNGVAPTRVLQTIASGLLGNAAFAGGAGIAKRMQCQSSKIVESQDDGIIDATLTWKNDSQITAHGLPGAH